MNQNNFGQNNGFGNNQQQNFGNQQQGQNQQFGNQQFGNQHQGGGMFVDNNQGPSAGNSPLPKGHYPVRITNAEYKPNNNGTGHILALECTVLAGNFATRKIFDNYNMQHENETAQNIGQANYAKLCQSLFGNAQNRPNNPAALIGGEFVIDYGPQRKKKSNNNTYQPDAPEDDAEPNMEVKDRLPISSYNHGANQPQQQQQQQVMTQQAFGQQQGNNQQGNFNQQQNQQFNNQQQGQGQQQNFGGNQQQTFQQPDNANNGSQNGFGNQQGGTLQGAQDQGQGGNGQGNGASQGDNTSNGNTGNVTGSPFNQGQQNGFGQGFGSM